MSQKSYDGSPTLYLVPTPIGNLEDITLRAISVLKSVDVIFSEDTRVTLKLLNHLKIKKKILSAHDHNEDYAKEKMLEHLKGGSSIALVTDRGTPIISDPGYKCARYIIDNKFNVVGLPGPTALIPALITSGIEPLPFLFYGFMDSKHSKRLTELRSLIKLPYTIIIYEAPHRISSTLKDMLMVLGDRNISIAREISKTYEEIYRGKISIVLDELSDAKGEMVVIVEGNKNIDEEINIPTLEHIDLLLKQGYTEKEAIKKVAKLHKIDKNDIYKEYHKEK
jgi:16S rRNA (cytidine1402-2'-O)-methyltransferase